MSTGVYADNCVMLHSCERTERMKERGEEEEKEEEEWKVGLSNPGKGNAALGTGVVLKKGILRFNATLCVKLLSKTAFIQSRQFIIAPRTAGLDLTLMFTTCEHNNKIKH